MKFIYADSLDFVDPGYDFERDQFARGRKPYWDDVFAHELLKTPPYDGLLVSRALLGGPGVAGKYSESQAMRFLREGARRFLRLDRKDCERLLLFGDCGAFSYHQAHAPPYSPEQMIEFYEDGGFTHGCSVDHIIFDFAEVRPPSEESKRRYELTLEMAERFLLEHRRVGGRFTPIGVVQGWSAESMANAAKSLVKMGYKYLALGGLVPLKIEAIRRAVSAVHDVIDPAVRLHLLGFAKAEYIHEFRRFSVASFDSTSPLIRAFKDASRNYWQIGADGRLEYFAAIRVPQASDNVTLKNRVKRGEVQQEVLLKCEQRALDALRLYDRGKTGLDEALMSVMEYSRYLIESPSLDQERTERKLEQLRGAYRTTLERRPWTLCDCDICQQCSIEVAIFRASNRNKRRGMHNLHTFHRYVRVLRREAA